jgi:tetratricopeptide (TPR) repeat protein
MVRIFKEAVRRRPRTVLLGLVVFVLVGAGVGVYVYALRQWHAVQAAVKDGRLAEARSGLRLCLFLWPRSLPVHLAAARVARMSGDFNGAEDHLNRCLKINNGATADVQLEFLLMRVQGGEADEVASALMEYVENKHPESALILETIFHYYSHNHRYAPALTCLGRWIGEFPDSPLPFFWRGWVLERLHDGPDAMNDFQRSIEVDPNFVQGHLRLAERWLERSNVAEALPHLEQLHKQHPDRPEVLARLGQCRFLQHQPKEARRLLEAAVEKLPNDPDLLITLGKLEMEEKRPVEAERWLRQVLKNDPYDHHARYTLVACLQLQGRQEEASAALEQYQTYKKRLERSHQLLKELAEGSANDPDVAAEAGSLLLLIGQERLGLYWLHQALRRDPGHQAANKALAEHYESKGDKDQAAQHRNRLKEPDRKVSSP